MLSAVVTWAWGAWGYVVHEGEVPLETGIVRGAAEDDTSEEVLFRLRHRWPELEPQRCLVLRGPAVGQGSADSACPVASAAGRRVLPLRRARRAAVRVRAAG